MSQQNPFDKRKSPLSSVVSFQKKIPCIPDSVFLADGARVIGDVELGEYCSVWFNAVVRGDVNSIRIGEKSNIQDGAVIHGTYQKHSTVIDRHVSIGHLAVVHGCTIEEGCLIGMHAVVMDGAVVGRGSLVAAGSVVPGGMAIPECSLVMGVPAKVVRRLTDEEQAGILATAFRYLNYVEGYNDSNWRN